MQYINTHKCTKTEPEAITATNLPITQLKLYCSIMRNKIFVLIVVAFSKHIELWLKEADGWFSAEYAICAFILHERKTNGESFETMRVHFSG